MKTTDRIRPSLHCPPAHIAALLALAAQHGATFRGKPSWRVLVARIAEGKLRVSAQSSTTTASSSGFGADLSGAVMEQEG